MSILDAPAPAPAAATPPAAAAAPGPPRPAAVPAEAVWVDDSNEWELGTRDAQGRREGTVRSWRRDGSLAGESAYRADVRHGPFRRFHPDGSLAREGTFEDGQPHGTTIAHGHEGPTPEPMQSCCVPEQAWQLETDYQHGSTIDIRWYDRAGVHILPSGRPHPPRPAAVGREARYDESNERWVAAALSAKGEPDGVWLRWSTAGVLREREEFREGRAHGTWQRFDEQGALAESSVWHDGQRDGEYRRIGVPAGLFQEASVHEERGAFARDQAVGAWSLHDGEGRTLRRFELGALLEEEALPASPALAATAAAPAGGAATTWPALAEALEGRGRLCEAILAAARAAAAAGSADPLRLLLARATPALTREGALQVAAEAVSRAGGKLALVANGLLRGGDATTLLRALASSLQGADRAALDLVDAALLMAPERHECRITRALINVHLGRPAAARADAAALPAAWADERAFLEAYARVIFPDFGFWPAAADIRTLFPDVPAGPEQPLPALRAQAQKYATRLGRLRSAIARRLDPGDAGDPPCWLPPDLSALLPDGPCPLETWEFEEVVVDDEAAAAGGEPPPEGQPTRVVVDEQLPIDDSFPLPALLRLARREWNALCWLCWSAGLDRVALPEAVQPPAAFGQAAAMSVERLWRCRDKLTTAGLRALTQGLPGFAWEGMEIDLMPAVLAEIASEEYREMRAVFYWLCDAGIQSPWQDNLRRND